MFASGMGNNRRTSCSRQPVRALGGDSNNKKPSLSGPRTHIRAFTPIVSKVDPTVMPIPIRVLSLILASDRRTSVSREFSRHGLECSFFDAIDGTEIPDGEFHRHYDHHLNARNYKRPLSRGEVACALGHRAIWQEIAQGHVPVVLVCEDDTLLSPNIGDFLRSVATVADCFENVMVKLDSPARNGEIVGRLAGIDIVLTRKIPAHTTGYLLGRNAARAMMAHTGVISRPIDADLKHYWEHRVPILLARPKLISFRPDAVSSLARPRAATKPAAHWRRFVRNLSYQSAMNLGRLRFPLRVDRMPELMEMRKLLADAK